ncbi:unnamed protein product, partial [Arabidopsis halleri]
LSPDLSPISSVTKLKLVLQIWCLWNHLVMGSNCEGTDASDALWIPIRRSEDLWV